MNDFSTAVRMEKKGAWNSGEGMASGSGRANRA